MTDTTEIDYRPRRRNLTRRVLWGLNSMAAGFLLPGWEETLLPDEVTDVKLAERWLTGVFDLVEWYSENPKQLIPKKPKQRQIVAQGEPVARTFLSGTSVPCPDCPPYGKGEHPRRHQLEVLQNNYSGLSVDIGACPECGHAFFVSYAVDGVNRAADWDCLSREEREAEEQQQAARKEQADYELYLTLANRFANRPASQPKEADDEDTRKVDASSDNEAT